MNVSRLARVIGFLACIIFVVSCGAAPQATIDTTPTATIATEAPTVDVTKVALAATVASFETAAAQPTATTEPTAEQPTETPPPPTEVASPTAELTATPECEAGCVLFEETWTEGRGEWAGGDDWQVAGDMLVSSGDASGPSVLFAPIALDTPDYAIEAVVEIVRETNAYPGSQHGLVARATDDTAYWATIAPTWCGAGRTVLIVAAPQPIECVHNGAIAGEPRELESGQHTYRLEVQGTTIRFLIDGAVVAQAEDTGNLKPGQVGIWSMNVQLKVHSVTITKL
jgi:hypothetical protein